MVKNQLHAEKAEAEPGSDSIKRMTKRILLFNQQEKEIKSEIAAMSAKDPEVKAAVKLITSIPGIGVLTAVAILAETNGFDLIRNKRQLTSYAGLDVREKQSGTSVKGKSRISKRGNKYLRKALHMPSLSTIQHDERFKAIYARIIARNGIKMKALVAVQRRLLEMTYTIFKTQIVYDKNYFACVVQKN
jgi:transposase